VFQLPDLNTWNGGLAALIQLLNAIPNIPNRVLEIVTVILTPQAFVNARGAMQQLGYD
jgi:hypothetical protein